MEFMDPAMLAALFGGTAPGAYGMVPPIPAMPDPSLIGSSMNPSSPAYPTMNPSPVPPPEAYRSEPSPQGIPTLGQSLEPVPMPRPRPTDLGASSGPTDVGSATQMGGTPKEPLKQTSDL